MKIGNADWRKWGNISGNEKKRKGKKWKDEKWKR